MTEGNIVERVVALLVTALSLFCLPGVVDSVIDAISSGKAGVKVPVKVGVKVGVNAWRLTV